MKLKAKTGAARSVPTDRYWPCQSNVSDHPSVGFALTIMQGPKCCFTRCSCVGSVFFGRRFKPSDGYTAQQVAEMGLVIT